ncbi:MAG: GNAT family N-acetyltransferase [Spirochaetaceae bacterium]|nr:GNAT family N-acetyltransferase [Spirochaetaceae bacterium]
MIFKKYKEEEITDELDQQIRDGLCRSFPQYAAHYKKTRYWNHIVPVSAVAGFTADDNDELIAHAGIIQREILINGYGSLSIFGIQNVFIHPEYRGKGLLGPLMEGIVSTVKGGGFDCGLLFCFPELDKSYSAYSWARISNKKIIAVNEKGEKTPIPAENIAMFYRLKIRDFPKGDINLQGNDW